VELFAHVEANLYTAVVADSLDELGYHNQAMNEFVRPLFPECRFAGSSPAATSIRAPSWRRHPGPDMIARRRSHHI